jgi:hypothetical protein
MRLQPLSEGQDPMMREALIEQLAEQTRAQAEEIKRYQQLLNAKQQSKTTTQPFNRHSQLAAMGPAKRGESTEQNSSENSEPSNKRGLGPKERFLEQPQVDPENAEPEIEPPLAPMTSLTPMSPGAPGTSTSTSKADGEKAAQKEQDMKRLEEELMAKTRKEIEDARKEKERELAMMKEANEKQIQDMKTQILQALQREHEQEKAKLRQDADTLAQQEKEQLLRELRSTKDEILKMQQQAQAQALLQAQAQAQMQTQLRQATQPPPAIPLARDYEAPSEQYEPQPRHEQSQVASQSQMPRHDGARMPGATQSVTVVSGSNVDGSSMQPSGVPPSHAAGSRFAPNPAPSPAPIPAAAPTSNSSPLSTFAVATAPASRSAPGQAPGQAPGPGRSINSVIGSSPGIACVCLIRRVIGIRRVDGADGTAGGGGATFRGIWELDGHVDLKPQFGTSVDRRASHGAKASDECPAQRRPRKASSTQTAI